MVSNRVKFGSRLGVILATAGSAVGLGNIWRFPYMTGSNGGAAFILVYIGCVLLLGLPCMVSEFIIGRRGASNTARAYAKLANGTPWKFIGSIGVMTAFLIIGYYSVVSGWCLQYVVASAWGALDGDKEFVMNYFNDFSSSVLMPILWAVAIILLTHFVIIRGVRSGIEKASKLMMPALFVLLIIVVVASCLLPGASAGIEYLFKPDFSKVDGGMFLEALGQCFYSLSIGMGCLCTYASYFSRDTKLVNSSLKVATVDTLIAILAGLMIFPAAFSVGIAPDSGPSLVFITLPNVFHNAFSAMPIVGVIVAVVFYMLLVLAALTSLISLHEVCTAFFTEELKLSRRTGAVAVTIGCCVLGAFCSLSFGGREWLAVGGKSLFDLLDFTTGQVLLPLGGFLTCLFLGWYVPKNIVRDEFTNGGTTAARLFGVYLFCVRFVCPTLILLIFLNQFGLV